ncbi:hypothetical protein [Kineococcus rhizosphaerae]|uniref:hypothetical protein n=1 Tax=Kineococcus rhizosphaerae TaxID=559628 RepID=UPI0011B25598|nr:hypothetical protein [Kineococcus rhizosphaerae]
MFLWEVLTALAPTAVVVLVMATPVALMKALWERTRRWSPLGSLLWIVAVVAAGRWLVESVELADATDGGSGPWGAWRWLVGAVVASGSATALVLVRLRRSRLPLTRSARPGRG